MRDTSKRPSPKQYFRGNIEFEDESPGVGAQQFPKGLRFHDMRRAVGALAITGAAGVFAYGGQIVFDPDAGGIDQACIADAEFSCAPQQLLLVFVDHYDIPGPGRSRSKIFCDLVSRNPKWA